MAATIVSPVQRGNPVIQTNPNQTTAAPANFTIEEGGKLDAGVIFLERQQVYLGVSEWMLVMSLHQITDFQDSLKEIEARLTEVKDQTTLANFALECIQVITEVQKIRADLSDFVLTARRVRRSQPPTTGQFITCAPDENAGVLQIKFYARITIAGI